MRNSRLRERLTELLRDTPATAHPDVSALAALFCFDIARLPTRLDAEGVFGENGKALPLKLDDTTPSPSGVVALTYELS